MTRMESPAHGLSDDDAQHNPFSDNSFQILMNHFVADQLSVDWILKNSPGLDGVSRVVQHVAQAVERVLEFERRHAEYLLFAAKVNRQPLVDQPFSRHREKEVVGLLKGQSVDALLGCDVTQHVRQSFDEGRAKFDLDVKQAIKAGDAIMVAKRLGESEKDVDTSPKSGGGALNNGIPKLGEKKSKRSTVKGEAREKIIATWTLHHQYQDGGALNYDPIGANELARQAGVSRGSTSAFFAEVFDGHTKYKTACRLKHPLLRALKEQNGDFSPEFQYDPTLLDERDEDEADRWDQREREGE